MKIGMGQLGIPPREFWKMTFPEFWAIHRGRFGDPEPHFSMNDVREMEREIEERKKLKHGKHRAGSPSSQAGS